MTYTKTRDTRQIIEEERQMKYETRTLTESYIGKMGKVEVEERLISNQKEQAKLNVEIVTLKGEECSLNKRLEALSSQGNSLKELVMHNLNTLLKFIERDNKKKNYFDIQFKGFMINEEDNVGLFFTFKSMQNPDSDSVQVYLSVDENKLFYTKLLSSCKSTNYDIALCRIMGVVKESIELCASQTSNKEEVSK
jgi:predicted nuclease with TOPRIM domain